MNERNAVTGQVEVFDRNDRAGSVSDDPTRRSVCRGVAALVAGWHAVQWMTPASANQPVGDDPRQVLPQVGDAFQYMMGDRKGQIAVREHLLEGARQEIAYPIDRATGTVRDASMLNIVLLLRFKPEELDDATRKFEHQGVIAYSGACTHHGCTVSQWNKRNNSLYCPCHTSEYDPRKAAEVVGGPAPRRLPMLPIKVEQDGTIIVAGEFSSRVGRILT